MATGTTIQRLIDVNCLTDPDVLVVGVETFLPRVPQGESQPAERYKSAGRRQSAPRPRRRAMTMMATTMAVTAEMTMAAATMIDSADTAGGTNPIERRPIIERHRTGWPGSHRCLACASNSCIMNIRSNFK
ncbi:MAG: hypothetical protein HND48_23820 [Chloroflexi bacterium]|nr:hypothetical protein [Chloroflexota bacterium]